MHCEQARQRLFDRLDLAQPPPDDELAGHLESCPECLAMHRDVTDMQARARVWHEVAPPPWHAGPGAQPGAAAAQPAGWLPVFQQWFPVLASTAALVLAVSIHWQQAPAGAQPAPLEVTSDGTLASEVTADQLLALSRRERQQELEALTALLKAEMDRRSLETEESLKYVISHQIQSQRELDAVRGRLAQAAALPPEQL